MLKSKKRIIYTLCAIITLIVLGFIAQRYIKNQQNYTLIKEAVAAQPYANLLTEESRSRTNECYPGKDMEPVCLQIIYKVKSPKECGVVIRGLKTADKATEPCSGQSYSAEELQYKNGYFRLVVGTSADGGYKLYAQLIGKE